MDVRPKTGKAAQDTFESYFADEIEPELGALESRRIRHIRYVKALLATGFLFLAVILYKAVTRENGSPLFESQMSALAVFALMFVPLLTAFLIYRNLLTAFKGVLTGKICAFHGFDFQAHGFDFPIEDFSPLLPPHHSERLEDRIAGRHEGVDFALCEGRFKRRSGGNSGKDREVFRGVLLSVDFHKPFNGETVLTPDWNVAANMLERIRQNGERIQLESLVFEDQFEVYSTDPLEARYLLSPAFMEKVLQLVRHVEGRKGLGLAFSGNRLLIAIRHHRAETRFEAGHVFSAVTDWRERADSVNAELETILSVIEILKIRPD